MNIDDLSRKRLYLLKAISGSKSYGLATKTSDTDLRGVFVLPKSSFYGMHYTDQVSDATQDTTYYELKRFVDLLSKNNPNILELLNTPQDCLIFRHFLFDRFDKIAILSRLCKQTFAGYAMTQIKKARGLNKKILNPVEAERKSILDFCYVTYQQGSLPVKKWLEIQGFSQDQCGLVNIAHMKNLYALYHDASKNSVYQGIIRRENAMDVVLSSVDNSTRPLTYLYVNLEGYSSYCKEYKAYWDWVQARNETRYQNTLDHGKNYDAKNMMHTFRLLDMAKEIAEEGKILVRRPNRTFLLSIRSGKFDYNDLVKMAEDKIDALDELYAKSPLPELPDYTALEETLIGIRKEFYQQKSPQ